MKTSSAMKKKKEGVNLARRCGEKVRILAQLYRSSSRTVMRSLLQEVIEGVFSLECVGSQRREQNVLNWSSSW